MNLVHYLNYDASMKSILKVSLYYIPKSYSYALPVSTLFAVAYTLGDLYAKNELTSIFSSGIPFWRLGASLIIFGFIAAIFSFYFEDRIVVPTFKIKTKMTRELRQQTETKTNSDIVIKTSGGKLINSVDYYDYDNAILNGLSIVEKTDEGLFKSQIRAPSARWDSERWVFSSPLIYEWDDKFLRVKNLVLSEDYAEDPETFRRSSINSQDLSVRDAHGLVNDLKEAGLPYVNALADYYHRFSFSSVSFIVVILSISMAGRFQKNIMLMSLFTSLSIAVVFYVIEMITMMMGRLGYIPPVVGAWFPVIFFIIIGLFLVFNAKT
jgi:lipopolysaccharide export system permease protein